MTVITKDSQYYYIAGKRYVRATEVLKVLNKPGLNDWRAKVGHDAAEQWTEETREIGSQVHGYLDKIAKGFTFNTPEHGVEWALLDERIRNGLRSAQQAEMTLGFKTVQSEMTIVSEKYGYAGTADKLIKNGGLGILDYKVSSRLWEDEVEYQGAAYWNAYEEQTGKKLDFFVAIRCDRDTGKWTPKDMLVMTPEQLEKKFELYICALKIWRNRYETT